MSSQLFPIFQQSGKYPPAGLALSLLLSVPVAFVLGSLYVIIFIPFAFFSAAFCICFSLLLGYLTALLLKHFKVRSLQMALLAGVVAGIAGCYFQWSTFVRWVANAGDGLLVPPGQITAVMKKYYAEGSPRFSKRSKLTGNQLALIWGFEALAIIGITAWTSRGLVKNNPFCEHCQHWLDQRITINSLASFSDSDIAALKTGDLSALVQNPGRHAETKSFGRLTLKHSPACKDICTLTVTNVTMKYNRKAKKELENLEGVVTDLQLPWGMIDYLKSLDRPAPPSNTDH